ncbi:MAG: DNA polymerase III subunit beta [Ndongobacter sp.]|nr:DNA polymerase III subunit beta [Ndongobacter sp.]
MKIQIMPQDMVRQISIAQRAISSRTTMPILECIRFEATGEQLILTATDLELSVETKIPCQIEEEGIVVIPATLIGNIFRKLPPSPATVRTQGDTVYIDCLDSHFQLQVSNASDFPGLPEVNASQSTRLYNDVFRRAIRETEFATSLDESKIALTGIYFQRKEREVCLVALDGYRLAVRSIPLPDNAEAFTQEAIVPRRAMNEWTKVLPEEGETEIRMVPGHIVMESGSMKLFSRLIEKKYIRYEDIISSDYQTLITVERHAFQSSLERASLLAKEERANLIKLSFQGKDLRIESNSEIGNVNERLIVEKEGEDLKIAFNAKYLLDGIRALDCESLTLRLNGHLNPMIMKPLESEDSYLYLVLPVRVGRE